MYFCLLKEACPSKREYLRLYNEKNKKQIIKKK